MKSRFSSDSTKVFYAEVNLTEVLKVNNKDGFETAYGCIMHTYDPVENEDILNTHVYIPEWKILTDKDGKPISKRKLNDILGKENENGS